MRRVYTCANCGNSLGDRRRQVNNSGLLCQSCFGVALDAAMAPLRRPKGAIYYWRWCATTTGRS